MQALIQCPQKELIAFNLTPKKLEGQLYFLGRGKALGFFVIFNVIIRQIFPENFIEISQVVRKI